MKTNNFFPNNFPLIICYVMYSNTFALKLSSKLLKLIDNTILKALIRYPQ